jgi:uncharacterized protein YhfF
MTGPVTTPLPPVDPEQVEPFWQRALAAGAVEPGTPRPVSVERFGDSVELADELIELVVAGPKRATAGALVDFEREGAPVPSPGDLWIATDGAGRPRALLRTTEVRVGPLSSVDDAFAWDEGEGDRTRASWLADHERFFRRYLPTIGEVFAPDMATVFERFEMVFP